MAELDLEVFNLLFRKVSKVKLKYMKKHFVEKERIASLTRKFMWDPSFLVMNLLLIWLRKLYQILPINWSHILNGEQLMEEAMHCGRLNKIFSLGCLVLLSSFMFWMDTIDLKLQPNGIKNLSLNHKLILCKCWYILQNQSKFFLFIGF